MWSTWGQSCFRSFFNMLIQYSCSCWHQVFNLGGRKGGNVWCMVLGGGGGGGGERDFLLWVFLNLSFVRPCYRLSLHYPAPQHSPRCAHDQEGTLIFFAALDSKSKKFHLQFFPFSCIFNLRVLTSPIITSPIIPSPIPFHKIKKLINFILKN